jgi:polyisoprenyl-teichoic acid--peptidoglycan teichoic acid transferase
MEDHRVRREAEGRVMTAARRRSVRRSALLALAGLVAWVAGAALGTSPGSHRSEARAAVISVGLAHPEQAQNLPGLTGTKPFFILSLGSDARPGQAISGERSDSIHIIGINPARRRASILGFPRDSWVPIPGHGTNKINSALTFGGPALTVQTIEQLTGIHIDYYMLTSFGGLTNMVDAIGGIVVNVPYPMNDPYSGADFNAGVQKLNGKEALAFSRNRHDTPDGDLSRSLNQGTLLISALRQLHGQFAKDPAAVVTWLAAGVKNVQTKLSIQQLLTLAFTALSIPARHVTNQIVPATTGDVGGASVVFIQPSAKAVYADMKNDGLIGK